MVTKTRTATEPAAQPAARATRTTTKAMALPATTRRTKTAPASRAVAVQAHDVSPGKGVALKKTTGVSVGNEFDLAYLLDMEFDAAAIKYEMVGGTHTLDRVSSGCLVLDLIHGGGFVPLGLCQMVGPEGSGKTTTITHALGEALMQGIRSGINDAENTLAHELMLNSMGKAFDPTLMERLRYHDQNILESYFDFMRRIMRALPDKVWNDDLNSFMLRFDKDNKTHLALMEGMGRGGVKADHKLSDRRYGIYPTDNSKAQLFLALDSLPALITMGADERESDASGGMSERARKLAEVLPKIAGRFRRKGVIWLAANSLRERPGITHGNPLYEAGGNVLKLSSVQRTWVNSLVPQDDSFKRDKENSALNIEANPLGGNDYYASKGFTNVKNKAGQPFLKGRARIWTGDPQGIGRGIDPVLDVWNALKMTGQVEGKRHLKFKVTLPKHMHLEPMTWMQFKLFVLAEKFGGAYAKALKDNGFTRIPQMRAELAAQIVSKKSIELMAARRLRDAGAKPDDLSDE